MNNQLQLAKELNESYLEFYNSGFSSIRCYAAHKGWSYFFAKKVIYSGLKINLDYDLLDVIYS